MSALSLPRVAHRFVDVDDVRVFYREAGPTDAPALLLLHGFPSSSNQYRRLIDAMGGDYHVIAPDYPGFGFTEAPADFEYSFERLADIVEGFVEQLGLTGFVLYAFDFGGPVGFRVATRHPEWIRGLIIQNANSYSEGLSDLARSVIANRPGVDGARDNVREIMALPVTRGQYEGGTTDVTRIDPTAWTVDQHFLDAPTRLDAQIALALDYHSNVDRYPQWQRWLRENQPPTLILWGRNDAFFPESGAHAYLTDLPDAEVHIFDTGHFALEENLPEIAPLIARFVDGLRRKDALNIAVIGASGNLGGAVVTEALARGHRVTRLGRATVDVTVPASIADAVAGHDAVVAAIKGPDRLVSRGASALLEALPAAGVARLLFVGGGGSLEYAPGQRFVDSPNFPAEYLETALDQSAALEIFRDTDTKVEWTYISPPPVNLEPGERTGRYRAEARDTPLVDAAGESRITVGDYASAIVDALEQNAFIRERFTAAY